jgi:hypothetical protein
MYDSPPTVADALASPETRTAGLSDAEAQRRLVDFGNEVEEVAHEALLLMFRGVRRFVPSPPHDFLRLTPDLLVLRSSRCLLRIVVDRQHRARD